MAGRARIDPRGIIGYAAARRAGRGAPVGAPDAAETALPDPPMPPRLAVLFRLAALAALALFLPPRPVRANTPAGQVIMQVVLIRHGIRAPSKAPRDLAIYASEPWPAWPVAPDQLTPHGVQLMRSLGAWYRRDAAASGLLPAGGCPGAASLHTIADSPARTHDSAAGLLAGFAPGCPAAYRAYPPGHADPLFHGRRGKKPKGPRDPALPDAALAELQRTLLGCGDAPCLRRARDAGKKLLLEQKPAKALKHADALSEDLMLEYAEGMPPAQVGWGRLDDDAIDRLIVLHNAAYALAHGTAAAARRRDGNLLAHLAATLQAAAGSRGALPPLAPQGTRLLFLVAHDTDLAGMAGLLGLDWHDAAQPDDFPPGGALIYQLVRSRAGDAVRLRVVLPTLAGLRAGDTRAAGAVRVATLRIPGCGTADACPLARFQALVDQAVPPRDVVPSSGDEPVASQERGRLRL